MLASHPRAHTAHPPHAQEGDRAAQARLLGLLYDQLAASDGSNAARYVHWSTSGYHSGKVRAVCLQRVSVRAPTASRADAPAPRSLLRRIPAPAAARCTCSPRATA